MVYESTSEQSEMNNLRGAHQNLIISISNGNKKIAFVIYNCKKLYSFFKSTFDNNLLNFNQFFRQQP